VKNATVQYLSDYTYSQVLSAGHHAYLADEPADRGGDDLGPGPYELLLWALGSCTAMTLLMYARRHEWDVAGITIDLKHDRVYAEDRDPDGEGGRIEVIEQTIGLKGDLSEEQRVRLQEIAAKCPVHKTLSGSVRIRDRVEVIT
jgi:putative redox protein